MKHRTINAGRHALTGVALAAACLWGAQAHALGLGRLNVLSVLGETLRADIDVTSLTAEEAASLNLRVASPEAYRAAGVEYNAALAGARVTLERRADGRPFLRVSGDRSMLEPFVDVIVEATWSSGRLVREYTMLFDPPGTRMAAASGATTAPVASAAPTAPATPPVAAAPSVPAAAPRTAAPPTPPAPRMAEAPRPAPAPRPAAIARPAAPPAPTATTAASGDEYRVRRGDSLSGIASRTQRPGISLDQMLVSLFRGNPDAFMSSNMNRLKAGAVLSVPSAEEAAKTTNAEARQVIVTQSADFAAYRQRLAAGAPAVVAQAPSRQAAGTVQAKVEDRRQATAGTPDKLKLSQGAVKASAPEASIAKEGERKDAQSRLAELSRNVEELKKLQQGAAAVASPATKPVAPAPVPATAVAPTAAPAPTVVAAAPAPTPITSPAAPSVPGAAPAAATTAPTAPAPAPSPAPVAVAKAPAAAPAADEPGLLSGLSDSPLLLPGAGVLVALLAGLGIYRMRGGMRRRAGETSFLESRLQPDSFFGASGGQRIDTKDAAGSAASSSMTYSLSQLDAIGDVDPVAEADVYLAYGRDLQAEEILKEAMRANPDRLAVRSKLLEVYAKRRDAKAFEQLATQVHSLTHGEGEDWDKAQGLGREIDPENPLYAPGGKPRPLFDEQGRPVVEALNAATVPHTAKHAPSAFMPAPDAASLDAGVDLDIDLDLGAASEPATLPVGPHEATIPLQTGIDLSSDADKLFEPTLAQRAAEPAPPPAATGGAFESLDFDLGDLDAPTAPSAPRTAPPPPAMSAAMDDDFGDFTLPDSPALEKHDAGDPLVRKLELAEEFRQIGDTEGARDLLEEVIAKAEGALKTKAQGMLSGLG